MSIKVKKNPLAEIISCKLFGIETVPAKEQRKMVNRAIKAAISYHEEKISKIEKLIKKYDYADTVLFTNIVPLLKEIREIIK